MLEQLTKSKWVSVLSDYDVIILKGTFTVYIMAWVFAGLTKAKLMETTLLTKMLFSVSELWCQHGPNGLKLPKLLELK